MDIKNKLNNELLKQTFAEEQLQPGKLDDLLQKHLQELRFLHFLKSIPEDERPDYYITSRIRMQDNYGEYVPVSHKMFYIASHSNGSIWLAICLYNLAESTNPGCAIINSADGQRLELKQQTCNDLLSAREKEILQLIEQGKLSKEIASLLFISINTVNRHRQNILEKLHVTNSIQACLIAKGLGLI